MLLSKLNNLMWSIRILDHFKWVPFGFLFLFSFSITAQEKPTEINELNQLWNEYGLSERHHAGLVIHDVEKREDIFSYKPDNYFIPASNIKILTMYAALYYLKDTIEAGWYMESGDSLIVWGGGDPGTLYPEIDTTSYFIEFLKKNPKFIYFSDHHFQTTRFGKGWAWDDYPYTYQCERNAFPIYGNRIWIQRTHDTLRIVPTYLASVIQVVKDTFNDTGKSEWGDGYFYTYDGKHETEEEEIPITFFKNDLKYCWSEATNRQIEFIDRPYIPGAIPIHGSLRDTLIKEMMFDSDNLIAEQLLLACSQKAFGEMNEELAIGRLLFGPLAEFKDDLEWVDGSGLSRYNLASPRSMIEVLSQMLRVKGLDYMKAVLPAGGKSGTLITDFKGKNNRPYIYAKSGSLKHTYCLSGILVTKSGKVLLFSWMNNQYHGSQRELKSGMEKIFSFLYDQY